MQQIARNVTIDGCGARRDCRYLLHDRDAKYSAVFCWIIETAHVKTLALPARAKLIGSIRRDWLDHVVVFSEQHLRHLLSCDQKYCNEVRALSATRNAVLALIAGPVVSPPLVLASLPAYPAPSLAVGWPSEGLKRSKTFISIAPQIGAKIDSMTGPELGLGWEARANRRTISWVCFKERRTAPQHCQHHAGVRWMVAYIDLIKGANDSLSRPN
jgi:hypothetical protein